MKNKPLICVIMAAGKGTRMKSALPKVLHAVAGLPLINHVIRAAETLHPDQIVVVVGPGQEAVAAAAAPHVTALQANQAGTGDAVKSGLASVDVEGADVLILNGDVPLIRPQTLQALVDKHRAIANAGATILGMRPAVPTGYGRLMCDAHDHVTAIIEELDATPDQRKIDLCYSGTMIVNGDGLKARLNRITNANAKGEYYLTDLVGILVADKMPCGYSVGAADELDGINDRVQLATAESRLQDRLRRQHMLNGVTLIDPASVYFSADTVIGQDVVIEPNVVIGTGVTVAPGVLIKSFSYIEGVAIADNAKIGPFIRIRPGTTIGAGSKVNNFVELKQTHLGAHVDVSQLCCVVDSDVGDNVNIGAGTITSNYNGKDKFRTQIGNRVFVGSNSTLIAPVKIGDDAFITAGSTITENVPENMVAFGRARQVNRDHTDKTILFSNKKKDKK